MNHRDSILFILCNAFPSFCADGSHFEIEAFFFLFISDPEYNNKKKPTTKKKLSERFQGLSFSVSQ